MGTIITLPTEINELAVKISANKQNEVQTVLTQIFTGTDDWEKQVDALRCLATVAVERWICALAGYFAKHVL